MRAATRPPTDVSPFRLFLYGCAITCALLSFFVWRAHEGPIRGGAFVYGGENPKNTFEILLIHADGQAYAALARDPLLRRPEVYRAYFGTDRWREEAAYRATRPLAAYAAWALSFGQSRLLGFAFALSTILGGGLASLGIGLLAMRAGAPTWIGPLSLTLPGAMEAINTMSPEPLGLAFSAFAMLAWERDRRRAIVFFVLAALTRETYMLIPAMYFVRHRDLRLMLVPGVWVAWAMLAGARYGGWWWNRYQGTVTRPGAGIAASLPWDDPALPVAYLLLAAALWYVGRRDPLMWLYGTFAFLFVHETWPDPADFGRPLLPFYAVGLLHLGVRLRQARAGRLLPRSP